MEDSSPCQPFRFPSGVVYGDSSAVRVKQGAALARAPFALWEPTGRLNVAGRPRYRDISALLPRWVPQEAADA